MNNLQILAISGSLRAISSNLAALQAAKILAAPAIDIKLYSGLANLPHFNPDDAAGIVADAELSTSLSKAIALFAQAIVEVNES